MAIYTTPTNTREEHYVERDASSGAGAWALVAVLVVLLALILFGSNFLRARNNNSQPTDINVHGDIQTPSNTGTGGTNTNTGTGGTTTPTPSSPTQ